MCQRFSDAELPYVKANYMPKSTYLYIHNGFADFDLQSPATLCTIWVRTDFNGGLTELFFN